MTALPADFLNEDAMTRYRREDAERKAELAHQRRLDERERQWAQSQQVAMAPDDYWAQVDERITRASDIALEATGTAIGSERRDFHEALRRRDERIKDLKRELRTLRNELEVRLEITSEVAALKAEVAEARQQARERELEGLQRELESLQRELRTLRDEVALKLNLKNELAAARSEVEELRQRAPSFESELNGLREQVAKQEKTIRRLRGEQSQLAYAQKRLDAEQQKNRREVSLTVTQMTASIGAQTREILHWLQENGFDLWEVESPSAG